MVDLLLLSKCAVVGSSLSLPMVASPAGPTEFEVKLEMLFQALEAPKERAALQDGEFCGPFGERKDSAPELKNLIVVNGFDTTGPAAIDMAKCAADRFGNPVHLIFNDLNVRNEDSDDWFQEAATWVEKSVATAIEKAGDADFSVNAATDTLVEKVSSFLNDGQEVHLVSHSAGAMCVLNALRKVGEDEELKAKFGLIHVLTVGSAVFEEGHALEDGWPEGIGSVHHLVDKRDPVAQFSGPVPWGDSDIRYHRFIEHYAPHLKREQLQNSGITLLGTEEK